jgi:hypothetical protein
MKDDRPISKAEPRFDRDLTYGKQGELLIGTFLEWIANGNGRVEVKRKRYLDLDFYIETHCDKGKTGEYTLSGISVTTAEMWAFVIGESGISVMVPTVELRLMLEDPSTRDRSESDGNCPTRGKLVNLGALLYRHKRSLEPKRETPTPQPTKPVVDAATQKQAIDRTPISITVDDIRWGAKF